MTLEGIYHIRNNQLNTDRNSLSSEQELLSKCGIMLMRGYKCFQYKFIS